MTTVANVKKSESGHWYAQDGTPMYTVTAKGTGLPRATTLRDARALNLLPSVTNILNVLHKEGLVVWRIEQAVLAVMTTPRFTGEADDAFITRVLSTERVQDQESQIARDRGTEIHDGIEEYFQGTLALKGEPMPGDIWPWIGPACEAIRAQFGQVIATERILVGDGYAGKTDLITETPECFWLLDHKTTRKLPPKSAWPGAKLQLAAYAKAFNLTNGKGDGPYRKPVRVANCYISTVELGQFAIFETTNWPVEFENGFRPLVTLWQHLNNYHPTPNSSGERPLASATTGMGTAALQPIALGAP